MQKVILITGGAKGLGSALVNHLSSKGHIVYFTSRTAGPVDNKDGHFLHLDVTSTIDCTKVINEIMAREGRLDVIINNAGTTLSGPTLEFSEDDFKRILDTNVIGSFRLIKAAFSLDKKPELIINITSLNGFFSFPNFGIYSASKFAAEALGLALRYELSATTKVTNLACGALSGKSSGKMTHKPAREKILFLKWLFPMSSMDDVAQKIDDVIRSSSAPARILVGRDSHIISWMQKLLPAEVFDWIVFFIWKKK